MTNKLGETNYQKKIYFKDGLSKKKNKAQNKDGFSFCPLIGFPGQTSCTLIAHVSNFEKHMYIYIYKICINNFIKFKTSIHLKSNHSSYSTH